MAVVPVAWYDDLDVGHILDAMPVALDRADRDAVVIRSSWTVAKALVVLTCRVVLVEPAGTSTPGGTVAALLLLATTTAAPPVGAGALTVTVPVDVLLPPVTGVGDRVRPATSTGPELAGSTVSVADLVAPAQDADTLPVLLDGGTGGEERGT